MEFDKNRVYTTVNADELKKGDMVILADTLKQLKARVQKGKPIVALEQVSDENNLYRFAQNEEQDKVYALAYLVRYSSEKKWRPYADCNEMVEDFKRRYGNAINSDNPMWHPLIWLQHKIINEKCLITILGGAGVNYLNIDDSMVSMHALLESYLYLDGSPCGIQE